LLAFHALSNYRYFSYNKRQVTFCGGGNFIKTCIRFFLTDVPVPIFPLSENNESTAASIIRILATVGRKELVSPVEKISINYADHSFVISSWNKKIYVAKKNTAGDNTE